MVAGFGLLVAGRGAAAENRAPQDQAETNVQTFRTQGVVKELAADRRAVVDRARGDSQLHGRHDHAL